ncbi:MAG TPA: signal recognition particle receptor subunit alpha, partial [Verrucomicrobiae bacterium]|nr:signal recognition particle receptor subunit alpha [Verrucomicrobiae bacterium]
MEEKKGLFRSWVDRFRGEDKRTEEEPAEGAAQEEAGEPPVSEQQEAEPPQQEKAGGLFSWLDWRSAEGEEEPEEEKGPGFFERLRLGLSKTQETLVGGIDRLLLGKKQIDADTLEELEELLITSDLGVAATTELIRGLEQRLKRNELQDPQALKAALKQDIRERLSHGQARLDLSAGAPFVVLVVGVNGAGKTTTIGKLAARFAAEGRKTLVVAGDTFRAAAIEQLEVWGERAGVEV